MLKIPLDQWQRLAQLIGCWSNLICEFLWRIKTLLLYLHLRINFDCVSPYLTISHLVSTCLTSSQRVSPCLKLSHHAFFAAYAQDLVHEQETQTQEEGRWFLRIWHYAEGGLRMRRSPEVARRRKSCHSTHEVVKSLHSRTACWVSPHNNNNYNDVKICVGLKPLIYYLFYLI